MSKYRIGKDIGKLQARVKALESRLSHCQCAPPATAASLERRVRALGADEVAIQDRQAAGYCLYMVGGFVGAPCPGIAIGDFLCISPCPPCEDIVRLRIVDGEGQTVCVLIVRWANGGRCADCPPGAHRYTWV